MNHYKKLLRLSGQYYKHGGVEDLIHIIAKLMDDIGKDVNEQLVKAVMEYAKNKIKEEYLNEEFIFGLIDKFF